MKFIEDGNENEKFETLFCGSLVIVKVSGQDSVNNGGYQVSVCVAWKKMVNLPPAGVEPATLRL